MRRIAIPTELVPESVQKAKRYGVYTVFITGNNQKDIDKKISVLKKYLGQCFKEMDLLKDLGILSKPKPAQSGSAPLASGQGVKEEKE